MHYRKLNNRDWKVIEERFEKKLSGWKGKVITVGGWLVLINSVLTDVYDVFFFELPKGVSKMLNYYRSRFYWQNDQHKKKYAPVKWDIICQPKQQRGLGIIDLELQNKCLLNKWLFKLYNENEVWQSLLSNKYVRNKTIG
jgi:hypothetical protein